MKKNILINTLGKRMLPKELNRRVGKRAYLIIDSTIKAKRQKFKTSHGFILGHCFIFAMIVCEDNSSWIIAVKP